MLEAAPQARVVNIASVGQAPIDFDDLTLSRNYSGQRAYGQSKLALIAAGFELAARLPAGRLTFNSLHPGDYMPTKMVLQSVGYSIDTLESGVEVTLRLIVDPALASATGLFFNRLQECRAHPDAYDAEIRRRLWEVSESLTTG